MMLHNEHNTKNTPIVVIKSLDLRKDSYVLQNGLAQSTQRIDAFPQDTEQLAEVSSVLLSLPTAFHSNLVSSANVTNCICLFLLLSLRQLQIIL